MKLIEICLNYDNNLTYNPVNYKQKTAYLESTYHHLS